MHTNPMAPPDMALTLLQPQMPGDLSLQPKALGDSSLQPQMLGDSSLQSLDHLTQYINPLVPSKARLALAAHEGSLYPGPTTKADTYKTVMCQTWLETADCGFGTNCKFAHGESELRFTRHPLPINRKYKTRLCEKYTVKGVCPYGPRCLFIHPEPSVPLPMSQFVNPWVASPTSRAHLYSSASSNYYPAGSMSYVPYTPFGSGAMPMMNMNYLNGHSHSGAGMPFGYDPTMKLMQQDERRRREFIQMLPHQNPPVPSIEPLPQLPHLKLEEEEEDVSDQMTKGVTPQKVVSPPKNRMERRKQEIFRMLGQQLPGVIGADAMHEMEPRVGDSSLEAGQVETLANTLASVLDYSAGSGPLDRSRKTVESLEDGR